MKDNSDSLDSMLVEFSDSGRDWWRLDSMLVDFEDRPGDDDDDDDEEPGSSALVLA